jgi:SAM-dependent methyltransferase
MTHGVVAGDHDWGEDWGHDWGHDDVLAELTVEGTTDRGEQRALDAVALQAHGAVLDLGVGAGRTTQLLAPEAREYVAVDVAPGMVVAARRRFPGADIRQGDVRDLHDLPAAHFDLVVFSFNGLDALPHDDRATALRQMRRVLRPDGRLVLSELNIDGPSFDERPWHVAGGVRSARFRFHVLEALRHPGRAVRALRTYRRTRHASTDGSGWATRPLRAHEFRFVVHFTTLGRAVTELRSAGLAVVAAYADTGETVDPTSTHTDADYVHFVCRPA